MKILGIDSDFIYFSANAYIATRLAATYVKSKSAYRVPLSVEAINELSKHMDTSTLDKKMQDMVKYRQWVKELKSETQTVTYTDPRLRPYQAVDVEFLKHRSRAAVFNEQRTGKTPTTLIAVRDKMKRGVIVCPAGLKYNWRKEVKTWLDRWALVVSGTPARRKKIYEEFMSSDTGILVLSYETLRTDIDSIFPRTRYDVLIVDEAHRLRNYKTRQSKALLTLSTYVKDIYTLTGTPAVNHPSDVFGILKLLRPTKFTSYWQFVERYFAVTDGHFGKEIMGVRPDRLEEFTNLLNDISVQRKRKDVMAWIPTITKRVIPLDMETKQARHYNKVLKEFRYGLKGEEKDIPNVLAQLTRLRQIAVDPGLIELDGQSPKTQFIKEFIDDSDSRIIIFSSFTSYLNTLATHIPGAVLLTGEQSQEQKQDAVDSFQEGKSRVLLANIKAGGVGWTIDKADTVIFTDRSYNPVDNEQAEDRFVPTNPNVEYGAKEIIDLVMNGSVEFGINQLLEQKQNIISYVNKYIENIGVNLGVL